MTDTLAAVTTPALPLGPDHTGHEIGGRLCLAFVNTLWWRRSPEPIEQLVSYGALVDALGADVDAEDRRALIRAAEADPAAADRALRRAVALRETLHVTFATVTADGTPPPENLAELDRWSHLAFGELRLQAAGGYALGWRHPTDLDRPAWQVALSATALLTGGPLERVKACPGPRCGWLFVDLTRNGSRRWCDPAQCGNRERVRAHYRRTHPDAASPGAG